MKRKRTYYRVCRVLIFLAVLAAAVAYTVGLRLTAVPAVADGTAEVHFIDVGQGDCELIRTADVNILIDAGPTSARYTTADYVKRYAPSLDLVILTHPHEDHIGGAADVLRSVHADEIMMTGATSDEACFARLTEAARFVPVIRPETGQTLTFGDLTLTVVSAGTEEGNENDLSIVVRADFGETSFLFTGDSEEAAEREMLAYPALLECDVLKVGHHGSASSTTADFIAAVTPQIAVIEVGRDNDYGHPAAALLDRLRDAGTESIFRTDKDGTVVLTTDGHRIKVFENS